MKLANKAALMAAIILIIPGCAAKQWAEKQYGTHYGDELPAAPQEAAPTYSPEYGLGAAPVTNTTPPPYAIDTVSDLPVKLGAPYEVGGKTYTPDDNIMYDEVGYASWYGAEMAGKQTANGEIFNPAGISAAHKTLPLPSYVEVTRIDTGHTILVRVNDRGPFANDRILDLSEGAARQLGIMEQGTVGVRVRRVSPAESERALLRSGRPAQPRLQTPGELLALLNDQLMKLPRPVALSRQTQVRATGDTAQKGRFIVEGDRQSASMQSGGPAFGTSYDTQYGVATEAGSKGETPKGGYVVQIAAFSSKPRANNLAQQVGGTVMPSSDGSVYRVRLGPYRTEAEAQKALDMVKAKGYPGARIFTD